MDADIAILHEAEKLEHLDLDTYFDKLDQATAERVSDAADRVTARYRAAMKDLPVMARVAMASAPVHPVERSVANGALMLTLIEEQTATRENEGVDLQSVYDNVTVLLGDSHFFEIVEQPAAACAMAVYATTAAAAMGMHICGRFTVTDAPHAPVVAALLDEHGYDREEAIMLSRYVGQNDHMAMLARILA